MDLKHKHVVDDTKSRLLDFLDEHPLYSSHSMRCAPEHKMLVLNFLGPGLPHQDQGDHEFYCPTILMLFKPWRSGRDLK